MKITNLTIPLFYVKLRELNFISICIKQASFMRSQKLIFQLSALSTNNTSNKNIIITEIAYFLKVDRIISGFLKRALI